MAGQGDKNNEADVRLLFTRKEVSPLSPHHLPISKKKANHLMIQMIDFQLFKMAARAGIEPATHCLEGSCSIH